MCHLMSKPQVQNTMRYASLATQWMVMLLVAVYAGYKLDRWLHWKVAFLIIFPLISLAVSLWQIVSEFTKQKK